MALIPWALGSCALAAGDMEKNFVNPPDSARPGVYWYFMDGNLNGKEMTADLEAMKVAGLGNLVFLEVDVGVPKGPVGVAAAVRAPKPEEPVHENIRIRNNTFHTFENNGIIARGVKGLVIEGNQSVPHPLKVYVDPSCTEVKVDRQGNTRDFMKPIPKKAAGQHPNNLSDPRRLSGVPTARANSQSSSPASSLDGIRRMVFLGDSITQSGDYVTDVECWLIAQGHRLEVLNIGLSSETATPLTTEENAIHLKSYGFPRPCVGDRLDRSLAVTKPDLVLVCYGMNDGSSLPEGGEGLRRYAEAVTHLRDTALRAGAKRVVLCTPPVHDPLNQIAPDKDPHERNLVTYRDWLLSMRADGWDVVDIHGPMRRDLDAARKTNSTFRFQPDGIHPDRAGHWVMAREILTQFFGADLGGISSSPQFFEKNGTQIRELVNRRRGILFSSLMTQIGHTRPQVVGGPGVPPGPSPETAQAQSGEIAKSIEALIQQ